MPRKPWHLPIGSTRGETDQERSKPWNGKRETYPRDLLVPQLVSAQAAVAPAAIAVTHGKLSLTYKELDARANQLAHLLRSLGVGSDDIVGLYMNRSLAMVVGALAILKAGGAYLPLDPKYPADRLTFLLKDAQVQISLAGQPMADGLAVRLQNVVPLDAEGRLAAPGTSEPAVAEAKAGTLAYVIYTSGSTGQPKGVEITHDSLLNLVFWHQQTFGVEPSDRATQLASPGFDAAVWELWPYLTAGASVFLCDDAVRNEPESLRNWLVAQRITITFVPTPLAERMMTLEWPPETALRIFLTGADTLHRYPPANLPFKLINNYGPTECTVVASSGPVICDERPDVLPTIGRPIANTQIYILNEQMQQVPVGVAGEIHIGGAGLARGYLNRAELTAERFVPSPFSSDPNARLYKTRDLARYLPDGQIAFVGRIDEQVKIRGYRIEPNEIVKVLDEQPDVVASAVAAHEDTQGDKYLVGYVVVGSGVQLTAAALQEFLSQRLPRYMVPSVFVRLESLPLTSNGKVDRASLPTPNAENTIADSTYVAPHTVVEQCLVGILSKLLGIDQVGVNDNFFLLGGHSLLGAQLIAEVRDAFGVQLTLRSIFDSPTAAALSAEIEKSLSARVDAMTPGEVQRALAQSLDQS